MTAERRRVVYTGRVHGVGFRFTARRIAGKVPVTGYVRNLPDGRVELLAEGEPKTILSDPALAAIYFGERAQ